MITLEDITLAQRRLQGVVVRTPLLPYLDHPGGNGEPELAATSMSGSLYLKPESLQPVGAFKLRGAYNKIASLSAAEKRRGVIAYSSGNHAQAVAYAARELGVQASIVMPGNASPMKLRNTRALGAEIFLVGNGGEERRVKAEELAAEHDYVLVPPYNDELVIAGQGTAGLEIAEDLPEVELVLVPVGGGGLVSGVAAALKFRLSHVRVIGVEPELAADAQASLRSGRLGTLTPEETSRTIADGLRSQHLGDITLAHIRAFVDDIITVSEDEIREAMRRLAFEARLVAEPSGAVAFAAYLFHQHELPPARLSVALISGGNVEPSLLAEILAGRAGKNKP